MFHDIPILINANRSIFITVNFRLSYFVSVSFVKNDKGGVPRELSNRALRLGCRIAREYGMAGLAKGINDAKKYRQKLRCLKNSREERVPFSVASSSLSEPRDDQGGPTSYSISRSSMCTLDLSCYPSPVPLSSFSYPPPYLLLSFSLLLLLSSLSLSLFRSYYLSRYLSSTYIHARTYTLFLSLSIGVFFFFPPSRVLPRALTGGSVTYCSETKT